MDEQYFVVLSHIFLLVEQVLAIVGSVLHRKGSFS